MLPRYGQKPSASIAPRFDDLINFLETRKTFNSSSKRQIDDDYKNEIIEEKQTVLHPTAGGGFGGPSDATVYQSRNATDKYKTDLKGDVSETMKMVMAECKRLQLNSSRLYRAPKDYYEQKIEWRRDVLSAPHIEYLCKSLLMKNTKCINKNCDDPTNSLYYIVIFQYVTKFDSEKMMKFVRKIHDFKCGKRKFKFRLAKSEENDRETGFSHNAVTVIGMKNTKIPIVMSDRLLKLDHFWLGGGEHDVKLAVDTQEFRNVFKPYVAGIVYPGTIDPNQALDQEI